MEDIFRVMLIGHRIVEQAREVSESLEHIIRQIIAEHSYVEFYIGRNGEFDEIAASVIKRVKQSMNPESVYLILVLPYPVADMEYYEKYYDEIIIPDELHGVHYKSVITKRNEWMLNRADIMIVYAEHEGGAKRCLMKANELQKPIIVISSCDNLRNKK